MSQKIVRLNTKSTSTNSCDSENELRRGPWTLEEDNLLIHYITTHGEGRWNSLARYAGTPSISHTHTFMCVWNWNLLTTNILVSLLSGVGGVAGLRRTGKSCRLRWLNYLKPDIKRGNLTPQEQILILELHSRWGNRSFLFLHFNLTVTSKKKKKNSLLDVIPLISRWSKIAQHLPGRTDNEIKNYWRTRVQKQARQLKVDSNSKKFLEAIRMFWMPRLMEKVEQDSTSSPSSSSISTTMETHKYFSPLPCSSPCPKPANAVTKSDSINSSVKTPTQNLPQNSGNFTTPGEIPCEDRSLVNEDNYYYVGIPNYHQMQELGAQDISISGCHVAENDWFGEDLLGNTFWNTTDELWQI